MPGRERQQKNNPGNYTADLWDNQQEQTRQSARKRRGKNGTVLINGVAHAQQTLFSGEDLRVPFPNAPINKVPDRLGMTAEPGTLFSRPLTEPQASQNALFVTSPDTANTTPRLPAEDNGQERRDAAQEVANPANKEAAPEPAPTASEGEQNPLLAILQEDEIYVDPNEVTIEEAEENGFPLLRRDVVTYKWWLEFSFDTREQPELNQALKDAKWRWGGYRKQWFTPAHFPQLPQDMPYANAGGAFYSEENAERIEARATKARAQSTSHLERSDQLASIIPLGQPMMPDHYSYRSDVAYRRKIWRQMDLFVEFYKKAEWLEDRAEGSRRLQRRKSNLSVMQNRIDRLQADVRMVRRNYEEAKQVGERDLDYYRKRLTILAGEIVPLQSAIAERGGLPIEKTEPERPLQPGDYILIRGRGMYVVKVNQKTIKVADPKVHYANGEMWELTYKKSDFQKILATKEELDARKQQGGQHV